MSAGNLHHVAAATEASRKCLGLLHRNGRVSGAMHNESRTLNLTEPRGDVVASDETPPALGNQLLGARLPFRDPPWVLDRIIDDDRCDTRSEFINRTCAHPHIDHALITHQRFSILDSRFGIEQNQRAHACWRGERGAQRQKATLAHPTNDCTFDAEVCQQPEAIVRRIPVREGLSVELGVAETTFIPRDHSIATAQCSHLRSEHLMVHHEPMAEDDWFTIPARVLEIDLLTVDWRVRHGIHATSREQQRDEYLGSVRSLPVIAVLSVALIACSSSSSSTTQSPINSSATSSPTAGTDISPPPTDVVTTTTVPTPAEPLTLEQLLQLGRPIVLAHAGGEDQHPHSTPYAYADSVTEGVDMLDFDVQLTKDNVLIVQHDDDVSRTTNGTGKIADMTYAELNALDNAYWFTTTCTCKDQPEAAYILRGMRTGSRPPLPGYTPDDFIIPRLRDIVERFPSMPLNIEIKGSGDAAIAAARELAIELTDLHRLANAVVTSFDDSIVTAFQGFAPTVEVTPGLALSTAFVLNKVPLPPGMRILQLPPEFQGVQVLTPETIAASKAAGYVIWVWPNDSKWENPEGYTKLLTMGLDGLNINFPDQGVAAVKAFVGK